MVLSFGAGSAGVARAVGRRLGSAPRSSQSARSFRPRPMSLEGPCIFRANFLSWRMHDQDGQVFQFGDFVLAAKERLLLHGGEPVPLTAKAFDLLLALVRRSGHLATKHELLQEVWPDTFVEDVNLSVNISTLRKALERGSGNG